MRKYINKHQYRDLHAQWKERKVSSAVHPPLETFLEHLHSLNILAAVEKKKEKVSLLSACHVCSMKETSLVLIRATAKSWGNCHSVCLFSFVASYTQSRGELVIAKKTKKHLLVCASLSSAGASMCEMENKNTGTGVGEAPLSFVTYSTVGQSVYDREQCELGNCLSTLHPRCLYVCLCNCFWPRTTFCPQGTTSTP